MIKILLVLLYLSRGQVVMEQKPFDDQAACQAAGKERIEKLMADPRFDAGIFAGCVEVEMTEVKK